ncbi:tetratricopeptide repeat protein 4-like [Portunus trituberculatus]|uniref:tetratricopeptide repeat protein 4-like n=1 Tax=Portunus trituberculatus TaxID=210409 RepID=UPI001E1D0ADE|nr:tetratricopeptide repeat protein 4-like [Portunus trituberculatus]
MTEEWKEKIIKEKLGGKRDWSEEERAALAHSLDEELEKRLQGSGGGEGRPKDAWTEDNWKEQMAEHPLFAPYLQEEGAVEGEAPINPLSEGLAQLKFDPDHSSPQEVAQNYKDEGNLQFKYKKYRLAVANFSEGLKQQCADKELNAQLYNNRAAAQCQLGNFRSTIKDCEKAFELKPHYTKVITRAVDAATKLKSWDEVFAWCDRGLQLDPTDTKLKASRLKAVKEKKMIERDNRRKSQEILKKKNEEQSVVNVIKNRGIKLGTSHLKGSSSITLEDLETHHPAAHGSRVHLNSCAELVWPVMLLYPEYQESDFIQEFTESDFFSDHLEVIFGEGAPPAPWDTEQKYQYQNLKIFFEDKEKEKLYSVDSSWTLSQALSDPRYCVMAGTPSFIIVVNGSRFMKEFLSKYK